MLRRLIWHWPEFTEGKARPTKPLAICKNIAESRLSQPTLDHKYVCSMEDPIRKGPRANCVSLPAANDSKANESHKAVYHCSLRENVWIPHSSFLPPQRPERGLFGSSGIAVQGWHPMLEYP